MSLPNLETFDRFLCFPALDRTPEHRTGVILYSTDTAHTQIHQAMSPPYKQALKHYCTMCDVTYFILKTDVNTNNQRKTNNPNLTPYRDLVVATFYVVAAFFIVIHGGVEF